MDIDTEPSELIRGTRTRAHRLTALLATIASTLPVLASTMARPKEPTAIAIEEMTNALTAPASEPEIQQRVRELSDPSYAARTFATRRLCAIGPTAMPALRVAAAGDDVERAMRARSLLATLDQVLFAEAEIRLTLSQSKIAWQDAVDLRLHIRNPTDLPMRIPGENPSSPAALSTDAAQVGALLDVADWLLISDAAGREIQLHVDDITVDPDVAAAVDLRIHEAPTAILAPRTQRTLTLRAFNRGWARYRMLDAGRYTVRLTYVPAWEDEALLAARAGRVVSDWATLEITSGAPPTVSRSSIEASMEIKRDGDRLIAEVTNRTDQVMILNTNLGAAPPFALARWMCSSDDTTYEVGASGKPGVTWKDFDGDKLVAIQPGASLALARITLAHLRQRLGRRANVLDTGNGVVYFDYINRCDRTWQRREGARLLADDDAPNVLRKPLPPRILSGRHMSTRLALPVKE